MTNGYKQLCLQYRVSKCHPEGDPTLGGMEAHFYGYYSLPNLLKIGQMLVRKSQYAHATPTRKMPLHGFIYPKFSDSISNKRSKSLQKICELCF